MPTPTLQKLSEKHRKVAALLASDWDLEAISVETGFAISTIRVIKGSPLMKAEVRRLSERILEKHATAAAEVLTRDTPTNLKFLKDVRDGSYDDVDAPILGHRVKASQHLIDRQLPKRTETTTETHHTFTIEREQADLLDTTAEEMGVERAALPPPEVVDAIDVLAEDVDGEEEVIEGSGLETADEVIARLEKEGRYGYGS